MKFFEKLSENESRELLNCFVIGVSVSAGVMLSIAICYCLVKNQSKRRDDRQKQRHIDAALKDYIKVIKEQDEDKKRINQALLQYGSDVRANNQILKEKIYKNNTKNNNFYAMEAMDIDNPEKNLANLIKNYPTLPTNSLTVQAIEATTQSRREHHEKVIAAAKDYLGEAYYDLEQNSHHAVLKIK